MDIFISWHGRRSHAVAEALRGWLPQIVNAFKPWLSSADIDKGARWRTELSTKLGSATAGIFCLTPSNLTAPWLIFEAGAISKAPETTYVCTLLVDLQPSDVKDPLAQFQATKATKVDIHQLVKNLNKALGKDSMDEAQVNRAFEKWWPDLENDLRNLPPDEAAPPPQRPDRELLEEVLDKVRDLSQSLQSAAQDQSMRSLRDLLGTPEQRSIQWLRNAMTHRSLDPDILRSSVDAIFKSAGVDNAQELNRALQHVADVATGQALRTAKKDVTENASKSAEVPKPDVRPAPADPPHAQKSQSAMPRPKPDSQ